MPSVPLIAKVITLTIDTEDFAPDVTSAKLVPTPGPVQTVKTLDGVKHQDTESETWALELVCIIDWDTTRPGLAHYLFANKGEQAAVVVNAHGTGAVSTTEPGFSCTVTLVPIDYGGAGNEYATVTVSMPVDGDPVIDTTP